MFTYFCQTPNSMKWWEKISQSVKAGLSRLHFWLCNWLILCARVFSVVFSDGPQIPERHVHTHRKVPVASVKQDHQFLLTGTGGWSFSRCNTSSAWRLRLPPFLPSSVSSLFSWTLRGEVEKVLTGWECPDWPGRGTESSAWRLHKREKKAAYFPRIHQNLQ